MSLYVNTELDDGNPLKCGQVPAVAAMNPTDSLTRQMLEWIAAKPRDRAEIMEAWRTSCPRLSIWEDACIAGLIAHEPGTGKVIVSAAGQRLLARGEIAEHQDP